jgi:hypothetical protein
MPVVNQRVMNMVKEEIQKRPEVTSQELFEKAKKLEKGLRTLSPRQFNATYPLQVRRTMAPRRPRGRGPGARGSASKERVKGILLEFARTVASAEDGGALVEVIGNLDHWVDRVVGGRPRGRRAAAEGDGGAVVVKRRGRPPARR